MGTASATTMTVKPSVKVGSFLTNGECLVEVRRVLHDGVSVEEASSPTDTPDIRWIGWDDVAKWRSVRKAPRSKLARSPGWIEDLLG